MSVVGGERSTPREGWALSGSHCQEAMKLDFSPGLPSSKINALSSTLDLKCRLMSSLKTC